MFRVSSRLFSIENQSNTIILKRKFLAALNKLGNFLNILTLRFSVSKDYRTLGLEAWKFHGTRYIITVQGGGASLEGTLKILPSKQRLTQVTRKKIPFFFFTFLS